MAERTVSVKLVADAGQYIRDIEAASRKTRDASDQVEQKLARQREAFTMVGQAAFTVGALALAGVVAATMAYANFEQAMSSVEAATHASADEMDALRQAALDAGAQTVFSATEAAQAIEELAKAGISTADILDGALAGSLSLAAAGGIGVAEAAETAASAMTQFGLSGQDVEHIADLLAAGAGKAQGGVTDLSQALNQAGLVSSQMGLSLEETVGSLAAFASAGLIGSDAGTSFRAMLLRLANPTLESAQLMEDLGLSFYDAQGQFIGMEAVAGQLQTQLAGLTQEQRNAALATIFGQDAIRAASILYTQGAAGISEWTAAVDDQGYAAETAAIRLDNLKGDLEALGGAFETLMINLGASGDGPLRALVQALTDLVTWLGNLEPASHASIMLLLSMVAAAGLAGGAYLTLIPKIAAANAALTSMGVNLAGVRAGLASGAAAAAPYAAAILGVITVLTVIGNAIEASKTQQEEWNAAVQGGADAADLFAMANKGVFEGFQFGRAEFAGFLDDMDRINGNSWASFDVSTWDMQWSNFASSIGEVDEALSNMELGDIQSSFASIVDQYELTEQQAIQLLGVMGETRGALIEQANAQGLVITSADGAIDSQALLEFALGDTGDTASETASAVDEITVALEASTDATVSAIEAQQELNDLYWGQQDAMSAFEQNVDDVAAALAEGLVPAIDAATGGFNLQEQSGRDASAMMGEMVANANEVLAAMVANGASSEELAATQAYLAGQVSSAGSAMGASADMAATYASQVSAIPDSAVTNVQLNTGQAQAALDQWIRTNDGRTIRVNQVIDQVLGNPSGVIARATGGWVPGAPSHTDNTLAWVASGEFIVRTSQAQKYRALLEQINAGTLPGYASGGMVNPRGNYQPGPGFGVTTIVQTNTYYVTAGEDPALAQRQISRELSGQLAGVV